MKKIVIILVVLLVAVVILSIKRPVEVVKESFSGVNIANEYQGTSTRAAATSLANLTVLRDRNVDGSCALGAVTITGAAAGVYNFYDATTTNNNLRTTSVATSSILLTTIPASAVAGTYAFDVSCRTGLLYEMIGATPTSTIMFR